ncbi:LysR substrate-binding domain-containing protein, partial [Actinotalea sp. JY-7885]|uniref:LysR substrate-binding domain-containing protein n=1 Tax=Actinotalea sp. JY-7885 TaxID=2758576 RepID=UPI00165DE157
MPPEPSTPFRVAVAPGVTVSKWGRVWAERRPDVPLEVVPLEAAPPDVLDAAAQVAPLHDGAVDAAFVRLPVPRDGLEVIPLWSEVAVVVVPRDHPVALFEEVAVADLVDEDLLQDPASVPGWLDAAGGRAPTGRPAPPWTGTADAVELVAAGVGVLVVPMSVARLHHRRDVTHRPVVDLEHTRVGLAWLTERTTPLVEEFIGIVRGRTARSSRGATPPAEGAETGTGRGAQDARGAG